MSVVEDSSLLVTMGKHITLINKLSWKTETMEKQEGLHRLVRHTMMLTMTTLKNESCVKCKQTIVFSVTFYFMSMLFLLPRLCKLLRHTDA